MKYQLSFFCLFFVQQCIAQLTTNIAWTIQSSMPASEVIYYDQKKPLVWSDFAGATPGETGNVAALTVSGFGYNANVKMLNGKGQLKINVYCYFSKNKSWVKPGKPSAYILTHEQHHFDVSYIAAVIFMDKLQNSEFTTTNYNAVLSRLYKECCDLMNKMQNEYDGQTKNGQIKNEQVRWNDLIDSRISSFTK